MIFKFRFWLRFGSHFGGVLGAQAEARPRPSKSGCQNGIDFLSMCGSKNRTKVVNNEVLGAPCFKGSSQVASRTSPGSIWERLWDHFGTMFESFFNLFCIISAWILEQHVGVRG